MFAYSFFAKCLYKQAKILLPMTETTVIVISTVAIFRAILLLKFKPKSLFHICLLSDTLQTNANYYTFIWLISNVFLFFMIFIGVT